ncbi:EamA family transporter [Bifidobacterium sp. LC6]|uniref:EamA family transporter n=2 Tax=Bifidobacterium colobi TaxID=2809026 RepID=A0ABS5UYM6_9BIFI|nr:EamA family transporter [Bifidobacterium colobi]MBT1175333.1 EamA family transporter [Bifidobacterium colobi]
MVIVGSLGIQTSSSLSASLFDALGPIPVSSMRMLVAAIVMLVLVRPKLTDRSKDEWVGIVVYGLAMAAMNICLYSAIDHIPMGVAVTLEFLGPCVVALTGSHHWREGLCALVALAGVGLISFTPGGYFNPVGYLFALGSAFCFGLYTLFADKVGKAGTGLDGLALSVTVAALATMPVSVGHATHATPAQWGVIAASALLGVTIPYTMDTLSGRITSARVVGTLFSIDPAMSVIIASLILRQAITLTAVFGVIVVSLAGALLVWVSGGNGGNGESHEESSEAE